MMHAQIWRRLGHIHVAAGESPWHVTHATYPTPLPLADGRVRVFFSPRDAEGRSSIFSLDLALDGARVERLGPPRGPWLTPGARGAFDDNGVSVSCVLPRPDGGIEVWYLGWTPGTTVPFRTAIGRAFAAPGEDRLTRESPAALLGPAREDPFVLGYPWAIADDGAGRRVWYGTHRSWGAGWLEMDHAIRRAVSSDGQAWFRDSEPALEPAGGAEYALSRPCVVRDGGDWSMWFCRRLAAYQLGFAHSRDGIAWTRADDAVRFTGEPEAWESGTQTYPAVFDHAGHRYMLYNGVGYGRSGFGLALLER